MKIASIRFGNRDRVGAVLSTGALVDVAEAIAAHTDRPAPVWAHDAIALIEAGADALAMLAKALEHAEKDESAVGRMAAADVVWHAPVRRPSKLCCIALNNSANADRIVSGPKHPAIFLKAANALIGHGQEVVVKQCYGRVHPEPELAVVIGKRAKDVAAADAYEYVFGYTVHNDITSPPMREEDTFNYRAIHPAEDGGIKYVDSHVSYPGRYKGSDTFSPLGPWMVTREEIPDPHALAVTCSHKGELVTEDNTANLFHKVPDVISFISGYITLEPGDVVSMGTAFKAAPFGGGAVQNVDLLRLGGPVSVTIEKIGTLVSNVARV